jgi:superfamily I DNA and/or RNA helicase
MLDEASMAPIPALWLAARLADSNVVVVGDVRQLPPIKQSRHPLAQKWLGRDIFDVSRIRPAGDGGTPPPHFVQLNS